MPTKNLFVLNNKNGTRKLDDIDFWNLTGRAGRLNKELFGNIYCIKNEDSKWENKKEILNKEPVEIVPTVITRINKNIQKIEKILNEQDISGSLQEQEVLKYIANIICIDTLEIKSTYESPIIEQLIANKKDEIIELAKNKTEGITVPLNILNSNQSINISRQQQIYDRLSQNHAQGKEIKLPSGNGYEICKDVLEMMYDLYDWANAEKKLTKKPSLTYYAMLMNKWISGFNLSQIIGQSIDYFREKQKKIPIDFSNYVPFEKGNIQHINIVIENIIDDIEYVLRFLLEKYFNHYYQILVEILGAENSGENWADRLEYGTQNRIVIALQNIGLSRHVALAINSKSSNALEIKDAKLISIKKELVLKQFRANSIEYEEINRML